MNKNIIIGIVVAVALIGSFAIYKNSKILDGGNPSVLDEATVPDDSFEQPSASPEVSSSPTPSVKEFTVVGSNFVFSPQTMSVKKGDTVRITFKNSAGMHDLKIDEFNTATKVISGGAQETIEFVADKTGSFEYYCSVGSHRQMGMKGTLTVTE